MRYLILVFFSISWIAAVLLINRLFAGHRLKINRLKAAQYITSMAAIGILGEIAIDGFYKFAFNQPLWLYRLFPIHGGYTSVYSLFEWGLLGLYIYLLHQTLCERHRYSLYLFTAIFCVDAILFELAFNGSYRLIFHNYIFYYLPRNLWHLSAIQAIPFYLLGGFLTMEIIAHERRHIRRAIAYSAAFAICLVGTGILLNLPTHSYALQVIGR